LHAAAEHRSIPSIVRQHAEEAAILRTVRTVVVRAPQAKLRDLGRLDERIAAHLDALALAGESGRMACTATLANPGVGEVFAATVRCLEDEDAEGLYKLLALAEAVPQAQPGFVSAFGWVSAQHLHGVIRNLLAAHSPFRRRVGIAACAMHQVDPGAALGAAATDVDAPLRQHALRLAGERGRQDLRTDCVKALAGEDAAERFWAARSTLLLGDRAATPVVLREIVAQAGPWRTHALQCLLTVIDSKEAHLLLRSLAQDAANIRLLIQGAGAAGDPHYVLWLTKQMADDKLARLAGESFTFITGLDLAFLGLDRPPPQDVASGPSEAPEQEDVAMDPDGGLPWPDATKIGAWWHENAARFQPGTRYFMGEPIKPEHCRLVLRQGCQRQRMAAAFYLALLRPGTPLFPTSAPAWRQKRWLANLP
jgi:uncharacterized protein (TIGR02270 family)